MKFYLLFFCLWLSHQQLKAQSIKLEGSYIANLALDLESEYIILERTKTNTYNAQKVVQNTIASNQYLWAFENNAVLNIQTITSDYFRPYTSNSIIQIAWEQNNDIVILSILAYDETHHSKILQRSLYSIKAIDYKQIALQRKQVLEEIIYEEATPFSTNMAPPLQDNANIAPIIGKYIAILPFSKKLADIDLYPLQQKQQENIDSFIRKNGIDKEKVGVYHLTFYGNNNIEVKQINAAYNTEKQLAINIGQWEYIDHENYTITLQANYKDAAELYALKGHFKFTKKQKNKYTLKLKSQSPIQAHNKLLHYYYQYFKRLDSHLNTNNKSYRIIGFYTHQAKLDFNNNYLPMALEKHGSFDMAMLFLEDIPRKYGQILHFKSDQSIEIIDILNNNPVPIPSQAFWYPSIDQNTYIIKYKVYNESCQEDYWLSVLYTFKKEDINSFVLEKWTNIVKQTILHHP